MARTSKSKERRNGIQMEQFLPNSARFQASVASSMLSNIPLAFLDRVGITIMESNLIVSAVLLLASMGAGVAEQKVQYNNETGVITCERGLRVNCASPYKSTNTTCVIAFPALSIPALTQSHAVRFSLVTVYGGLYFYVRVGFRENRAELPFIWLRPVYRCRCLPTPYGCMDDGYVHAPYG